MRAVILILFKHQKNRNEGKKIHLQERLRTTLIRPVMTQINYTSCLEHTYGLNREMA